MFGAPTRTFSVNFALFLVALALFPVFVRDSYYLHVGILCMLFASFALSWHLVTGYGGLKTFGHQAFFGIGAYFSALVSIHFGISPWLLLLVAGIVAAILGLLIATPVLRIRSMPHVAIVTLSFAEIIRAVISNWRDVTRGELGLWGIRTFESFSLPLIGAVSFTSTDKVSFYYLMFLLFALVCFTVLAIMRSQYGLAIIAMRESENAADSLGVNIVKYKLFLFALSAFFVGVCGSFYAHYLLILTPSAVLHIEVIILVIAMTLVGGVGTFAGPIIGAFLLTILGEWLRGFGDYRMLIYGTMILLCVMFFPGGVAKLGSRLREFGGFSARVARR